MKKLITSIAICLITAILLSACSTSGAFTKRRYTRGYYISHQHARHNTSVNPTVEKGVQQTSQVASVKNAENPAVKQTSGSFAESVSKSGKMAQASSLTKRKTANRYVKNPVSVNSLEIMVRESFKRSNSTLDVAKPMASDADALSLFWVVIIIILILWLLGVLTGGWGLGGLIHLLLIIALILLILWLLRIL
jgi:hypothetical protein